MRVRETRRQQADRAREIIARLCARYPEAKIALHHSNPFELLVAVILSAQCTDVRVNQVTPALFARFPDPEAMSRAGQPEVEELIRSCGLYRNKAKALIAASRALVEQFGSEVPNQREVLAELPGVGNKTAGVVAMHLEGDLAFPVDTHVARLAWRMDLTRHTDPDKIERDLKALLPHELWMPGHHALIFHGRQTCLARSPRCELCPIDPLCPKRGVTSAARRR